VVSFKRKVYRMALEELIKPFKDALADTSDGDQKGSEQTASRG